MVFKIFVFVVVVVIADELVIVGGQVVAVGIKVG